eukprot:12319392-Alexandrium_andersonii.AAC.1
MARADERVNEHLARHLQIHAGASAVAPSSSGGASSSSGSAAPVVATQAQGEQGELAGQVGSARADAHRAPEAKPEHRASPSAAMSGT